jgi:hypothetical protein
MSRPSAALQRGPLTIAADDYRAWSALHGQRPYRLGSAVYWLTEAAARKVAATLDGRQLEPIGPGAPSEVSPQ